VALLALILVTAVWGVTFVQVKDAIEIYPLLAFLAVRYAIATGVLGIAGAARLRTLGRSGFAAARQNDERARAIVAELARRIALHISAIAAVADVGLVVLGGGIGSNGDLLLEPVRKHLADWLPYPPQVEVSSLGEAAVLTGALAVGLRSALDNVFVATRG